jgi:hypothetical protein
MVTEYNQRLPVVRVGEIPREEKGQRWLVEQLWGDSSVGVIGGAPKCSKTWLGLDMALSVAIRWLRCLIIAWSFGCLLLLCLCTARLVGIGNREYVLKKVHIESFGRWG